jgi:drug/metabolite transporter (DMT)-like permease
MAIPTVLVVLVRIVANPLSNVFQKQLTLKSASPVFIIGAVHALLMLACVPVWFVPGTVTLHGRPGLWATMTACAFMAVAGNAALVAAVRSTDLSVLGPINAYKSVVGLLLGIVVIGELPTAAGVIGVLLIAAGSSLVVDRVRGQTRRHAFVLFFQERGIQLRFAALGLSATEAVFLKQAILLSSPLTTFVLWCMLGALVAAAAILLMLGRNTLDDLQILKHELPTYLRLTITTGVMQLATVFTFGTMQVGYSLALFQLSALISVFLGYRYFQEGQMRSRIVGSLVMTAGATLIVMWGGRR